MLYEIKGKCQLCHSSYKIIISDTHSRGICDECGEKPLSFKKYEGVVYVINNPNQKGVKIGLTTKGIDKRVRELETTGVAGKFKKVAIFPSFHPKNDEKKAHDNLKKYRLDKEHFQIEPTQAVLKIFRALNRKVDPIFFDKEIEQSFYDEKEKARRTMLKNLGKID